MVRGEDDREQTNRSAPERRLFVTTQDPDCLLADLQAGRGGFVPTRIHLELGERVLLGVSDQQGGSVIEIPVVVLARKIPKAGRCFTNTGVVVRLAEPGDDEPRGGTLPC
jgi:hypothetical protein